MNYACSLVYLVIAFGCARTYIWKCMQLEDLLKVPLHCGKHFKP